MDTLIGADTVLDSAASYAAINAGASRYVSPSWDPPGQSSGTHFEKAGVSRAT